MNVDAMFAQLQTHQENISGFIIKHMVPEPEERRALL
jgi:hypothetical protein